MLVHLHRYIWLWLVPLTLACSTDSSSSADCDADCRQKRIIEAWPQDRERATELVNALEDPVEQIATISKLLDLYPGQVEPLCERLPEGLTRNRCTTAARRSHLHTTPPDPGDQSTKASAPTPDKTSFSRPSSYANVVPILGDCASHTDLNSCLLEAATQAAKKGNADNAAALCMSVPVGGTSPTRWRSNCFFESAQTTMKAFSTEGYRRAVDLCSAADLYNFECQRHLINLLTVQVPGADEHAPESWRQLTDNAKMIEETWQNAKDREVLVSGFWAIALLRSVQRANQLSGDAIDHVPPEALPHLRAAAATRMLSDADPSRQDLTGWVSTLHDQLSARSRQSPRTYPYERLPLTEKSWIRENAEEEGIPLILNQGSARRVLADSPDADLAICILEAASRLPSVPHSLLQDGLTHTNARVRWTAKQLLMSTRCNTKSERNSCLRGYAIEAATAGDTEKAAALCASVTLVGEPPTRLRTQCFLQASMKIMNTLGDSGYAQAAALCGASQATGTECHRHLIGRLTKDVPAADQQAQTAWNAVVARAKVVEDAWKDNPEQDRLVSGFWAVTMARSVQRATHISSDALTQIPTEAIPHLRAAAAARLMQGVDPNQHSLETWVAKLNERLQTKASDGSSSSNPGPTRLELISNGWPAQNAQADGMPTILYRGSAQRVLAPEPGADMAICILEAAARQADPPSALIEEGLKHSDPRVRWSARQLSTWLAL